MHNGLEIILYGELNFHTNHLGDFLNLLDIPTLLSRTRYNGWDDPMGLANVILFLEETAKCWYGNVEESYIKDVQERATQNVWRWELFCSNGRGQAEKLCSKNKRVLRRLKRVGHLMKGVEENIYQALLPVEIATVEEFCKNCRRIEALKKRNLFVNVTSISTGNNKDLEGLLCNIEKEESTLCLALDSSIIPKQLEEEIYQRAERSLAPIIKHPKPFPNKSLE
ncbi:hypothetical protein LAZ67_1006886 [Cordylochernes scorpioides]|uniref:Uncharacterized protein n=1 Tax=Cordylochernes scorpioides TaxID=51811 RepID=A0ABY6JZ54_9ARAC|nr:hypothetical protein LAZ67_1006886 [Cordylochernes scorpioides]